MPQSQDGPAQLGSLPRSPQSPIPTRNASRLLPVLGVVMGLLGLLLGAAAWFRAGQSDVAAPPVYSKQEVAEATEAVCGAYAKGVRAFQVAGSRQVSDSSAILPIAVNTRLAEVAVGNYLINSVDANPATPNDLKKLIKKLAQSYQDIALTQLAESSDYKQSGMDADEAISQIENVCP